MEVIDVILNLAALLLWLNWRSLRFDPLAKTSATSLVGTLRRAEHRPARGWRLLLGLALLLFLRAIVYWMLGAPAEWTPKLHLKVVVLAFRVDHFAPVLLYSVLGFCRFLAVFYFWLLVLALYDRSVAEADPILKLIRLHIGRIVRWPWPLLVLLVPLLVASVWASLHPVLVWAGAAAQLVSAAHLLQQSLLLTLALTLTLKYVLPVFLLLHFVASYVYLGSSPVWEFIATTAGRIMAPMKRLPLRLGKLDLRPLAATALIFLLLDWLPQVIEAQLAKRGLPLWPQ